MPRQSRFSAESMSKVQARSYGRLAAAIGKRNTLLRMLKSADTELTTAVKAADKANIPHSVIAEVVGYTESRVWQIVNDWHPAKAKASKGEG